MTTYCHSGYFKDNLDTIDPAVHAALSAEQARQNEGIELIASENIVSQATLDALGAAIVNKTVEGYPGKRYYGGAEHADTIEQLAIDRAKELFGCAYANVQPHSGSQANLAVFLAYLKPGDTVLSMDLSAGGHLSHGSKANLTGKWFHIEHYGVDPDSGLIDYDEVARIAHGCKPKLIICGTTAYSREVDWKRFRAIADEVGAYVLADITHIAGLVAAGIHPSPIDHAHFVTTCTHKQLYGGRGGLILIGKDYDQPAPGTDKTLAQVIQKKVFPFFQGAPNQASIAAKARGLAFVGSDAFKDVAQRVVALSRALAQAFVDKGYRVITGGSDNHIVVVDTRQKGITGVNAEKALEDCGIVVNKNRIPFDEKPPSITSGIRLGTNGLAIREMEPSDMVECVEIIHDILSTLVQKGDREYEIPAETRARAEAGIAKICARRPITTYPPVVD